MGEPPRIRGVSHGADKLTLSFSGCGHLGHNLNRSLVLPDKPATIRVAGNKPALAVAHRQRLRTGTERLVRGESISTGEFIGGIGGNHSSDSSCQGPQDAGPPMHIPCLAQNSRLGREKVP